MWQIKKMIWGTSPTLLTSFILWHFKHVNNFIKYDFNNMFLYLHTWIFNTTFTLWLACLQYFTYVFPLIKRLWVLAWPWTSLSVLENRQWQTISEKLYKKTCRDYSRSWKLGICILIPIRHLVITHFSQNYLQNKHYT